MFIDSDYSSNGFDRTFGEEVVTTEYSNAIGETAAKLQPLYSTANTYNVQPTKNDFKAAGESGCTGWMAIATCSWLVKLPKYASGDSHVRKAFDDIAKTRNSYGYDLQEMKDKLAEAQQEVNSQVPLTSNMNCLEMDNAIAALNTAQVNWNSASVTHQYDRDLRGAYLGAIASSMALVTSYMDARDCNGATSAIDTSQAAAIAAAAAQAQAEATAAAAAQAQAAAAAVANSNAAAAAAAASAAAQAQTQQASQDMQTLKDLNQSEIDALAQQAEITKAETDKKNKMMMFGAAVIIAILVLKK
jgi:hypothetical protein